jgi:EmrB/QacA subfamily drug resistance transporter
VGVEAERSKPERLAFLPLLALALSIIAIGNDFTALNVTIPALEHDYGIGVGTAQWVINAYMLVFAMLIVPGGRLVDLFGRGRMFVVGASIFLVFSLVAGLAPGYEVLIAARAVMGAGAALMWPATLGMTFELFGPKRAALAGAFVIGISGLINAAGPIDGGALTQLLSWRWVFLLNVPIAVFAIAVVWRNMRQPPEGGERTIDYPGIATLSFGLLALLVALDQTPTWGWGDWRVLTLFAIAGVLLVTFFFIQRRQGMAALVPTDVARNPQFMASAVAMGMIGAGFFTTLLYLAQVFQKVMDMKPLASGVGMLPLLVVFGIVSFVTGKLYDRFGARLVVPSACVLFAVGTGLLALMPTDPRYLDLVPGMVIAGIGTGAFYSSITTAGVSALDPSRTGLAGGILYMCQLAGGALGLVAATTIVTLVGSADLDDRLQPLGIDLTTAQHEQLFGLLSGIQPASAIIRDVGARLGDRLEPLLDPSFTTGVKGAFLMVAILALLAAVLTATLVKGEKHPGQQEP